MINNCVLFLVAPQSVAASHLFNRHLFGGFLLVDTFRNSLNPIVEWVNRSYGLIKYFESLNVSAQNRRL